ncbi:MAG: FAD-dependent oxidoreductase [Verrucomicrobia bacterium]|nr:FAD-dependent oxidoreductase [Verrucomicrobiota bacterium]
MAKQILIIGAGVIGLSTAYYAARKGHRITVIDREPEQRDGCSFGNAGMIVPSHFTPLAAPGVVALGLKWMWHPESPFYIKPRLDWDLLNWGFKFWRAATPEHVRRSAPLLRDLSFASRACFEELAGLPENDFGLVQKGLLMLCRTQHALDDEAKMAEQARALGIPAEVFDAKQTAALEPNVRMDIAGSVYFPKDCHLSPNRFMAALKRQLDQLGVKFSWETEVTGWRVAGKRIEALRTNRGEFDADEYVICSGSWSPVIARDLRLKLPMQAGKGYSLTLVQPRQLPAICCIFTEARVAVTPMASSLRFGGTMEIAGLNETINPVRVRGIINAVPKYFPELLPIDFDGVQPWCGLRPCSPDGLPYVGRTSRYANLAIATGHAMMGLSLGPITGRLMAEILSDEKPALEIDFLNPDRYG